MNASQAPAPPPVITCCGGCKRTWPAADIEASGWELLSISTRYRCGECTRELHEVAALLGVPPGDFVDAVPPGSRGALPKETSLTILPPAVRG